MISKKRLQVLSYRRLLLSRAKLKATSRTSALLSGFAMIALVEVELDQSGPLSAPLIIAFSVCTTLVVAVHLVALLISTCILPNLEAAANIRTYVEIEDLAHEQMHWYIELAWILSTGFGIILFLLQMALLAWVRFLPYSVAAPAVSTAILIPLLGLFIIFAFHFYRRLVAHQYELATKNLEEVEMLASELEGIATVGSSDAKQAGVNNFDVNVLPV